MKITKTKQIAFALCMFALMSCKETIEIEEVEEVEVVAGEGLDDWSTETHTDEAGINYDIVFPQDQVNRIDIVLTSSEYSSMRSNLASLASQNRGTDFTDEKPDYVACDFYFNGIQWYEVE